MQNQKFIKKQIDGFRELTEEDKEIMRTQVARGASEAELRYFLAVCKRAGLDPVSRQIHFIKRGDRGTVQVSIDGFRTIAARTGQLAGIDDPVYDSEVDRHPHKATVSVWRMVNGQRFPFTATARWEEYKQEYGGRLATMWEKMPYLMLGKCAESLALRKAFPNELSGLYTREEMMQADEDGHTVAPTETQDESSVPAAMKEGSLEQEFATPFQLEKIDAILEEHQADVKAAHEWIQGAIGAPLEEMTKDQASKMIDLLQRKYAKQESPVRSPRARARIG